MGARGPAPKPTAIRKIEGNPSRRPMPREPRYPVDTPAKPRRISKEASKVWDELVGQMRTAELLRQTDGRALWHLAEDEALLTEVYDGIWKMAAALKDEAASQGKLLPAGEMMALLTMKAGRLAMGSIRDLGARVIVERREFGLTPASRSRIAMEGNLGDIDPIEAALCG
jgi:phage terminase small subunit